MGKVIVIRHSDDTKSTYEQYINTHGPHFNQPLLDFACSKIKNADGTNHKWTTEQVKNVCDTFGFNIPDTSTIEDVAYTANMAYADFYPDLLNAQQCVKYAASVAADIDGYEGIQFKRWVADMTAKNEDVDWEKFI